MLNSLNKYKNGLVVMFLISFGSVFACDFLCDLGVISIQHQLNSDLDTHHSKIENEHDHGSQHDHNRNTDMEAEHHSTSDSSVPDDCCDDMSKTLYSSLIQHSSEITDVLGAKLILIFGFSFKDIRLGDELLSFKESIKHCSLPPPLKGYDIRVIIQSFLN